MATGTPMSQKKELITLAPAGRLPQPVPTLPEETCGSVRAGELNRALNPAGRKQPGDLVANPYNLFAPGAPVQIGDMGAEVELVVSGPGPGNRRGSNLINPGQPAILRNNRPITVLKPDDHLAAPLVVGGGARRQWRGLKE